jgi:GNAT superfamily N-acetyltransferase
MIIRKMLPDEIDSTVLLTQRYFDEAAENIPNMADQYDENSVLETIKQYSSHYEYFWYNAYEGLRPVGFIAGFATPILWNSKLLDAHIALIYLLDSHRSMANFKQLMDKFEEWAKTIGAGNITAGDIGINPERTEKLYEHFGYKRGVWMGKELNYE